MKPTLIIHALTFAALCFLSILLTGCAPTTQPESATAFMHLSSLIHPDTHFLRLPAGNYQIGPETLEIPANFHLIGAGPATVIHAAPGTKVALSLGSGAHLSNLTFDAKGAAKGNVNAFFISVPANTANQTLDNLHIFDCPRTAIGIDRASGVSIRNCRLERITFGVNILFSRNVRVQDNTVIDARMFGLQFWGNWNWQEQLAANLLFSGNTVIHGGNCCIWGSGGRHIIMSNNSVDGAKDVGLDLEWCSDSVISANVAQRCRNAGIALFFACRNVAITGNSVVNDAPITPEDANADWWVRSGIWLTYPNRHDFPADHGHENITIVGNTISCAKGPRRAIWVGSEARNIVIANNAITGAQVFSGGQDGQRPLRLTPQPNNITLAPEAPLAPPTTSPIP